VSITEGSTRSDRDGPDGVPSRFDGLDPVVIGVEDDAHRIIRRPSPSDSSHPFSSYIETFLERFHEQTPTAAPLLTTPGLRPKPARTPPYRRSAEAEEACVRLAW
jgi:hypothetical protein